MNDAAPRHPEAQKMAAFVEGTLAPAEIAEVAKHLRDCGDCRTVVSETARFVREEDAPRASGRPWLLAVAAILAAVAITIPVLRWRATRASSPIARLIAVAPRDHRVVEARLSGFPWARMQAPSRGDGKPDPADLKVAGAAGDVLEETSMQQQPEARHATGVAYLLIERRSDSIPALEQAARKSADARAWNDLAAARFAVAVQDEHPSQLPEALADADHALRLDPKFPEALFNRALIIEHLGLREQARDAWKRYLDADPGSEWSVEARAHLRELEKTVRRFDPKMLDTIPADALVREFPQEVRTYGEVLVLAAWAEAEANRDAARASATLTRARVLSDALARWNGERLLNDAVVAIDRSSGQQRAALVSGHRLYRDAKADYIRQHFVAAEKALRRAAELFTLGGSPMASVAAYYAASAAFDQNRGDEAHDQLAFLLSKSEVVPYRALTAQIHWELAVCANRAGDWGAAARHADTASTIFRALGERTTASFTDSVAAYAMEVIGDEDSAWSRQIRALEGFCGGTDRGRCNSLLSDIGTTLASIDQPAAATALIDLTISNAHGTDASIAMQFAKRARVRARTADTDGVGRSLEGARRAIANIVDPSVRETTAAQIAVEDAGIVARHDPRAAIATLDQAVEFFQKRHLNHLISYAYLQRARAWRTAGDKEKAAADYSSALNETVMQQNFIADPSLRFMFLDTATEAIEESIELDLSRGATASAFRTADRRHALTGDAPVQKRRPGVGLIEYAVLPHSLAIFCVVDGVVSVESVTVDRHDLAQRIGSLAEKIRARAPTPVIERESALLHQLLVAPIHSKLAGIHELVIVPDRHLYAVPFAALYDDHRQRFLVEDFDIRFATAASSPPATIPGKLLPALVIADPHAAKEPSLRDSRKEAARIAALYQTPLISGEEATVHAFADGAVRSALIHFAGHANSDTSASYGALRLAASGNDSGILSSNDIAHLPMASHPLVVLAACGTFRGDPTHVAGMLSLARAFLMAGARGVVGTLWEIDDDASAPLFIRFHELLRAGLSPAHALRQTEIEMLHSTNERLRHPATWSPVELLQNAT